MDVRTLVTQGPSQPERSTASAVTAASVTSKSTLIPVEIASAVSETAPVPSQEQLKTAIQNLNKTMKAMSQDLEFSVDEDSNRTIVKVVDQQTNEVIRQLPSKEALEIAKALDRMQGVLINQQA
ncbi:MAG TPA: flagellar protein FlaG [Noviherbaspirillum sp.]|jgi:flagellar protein FlaG|uniref:flagellar protein FlaG n=1 Tax=Noviherbaspirillum sp. TaxID=1926288 RepID=UPI002DDCD96B|nr:flagellar protein FlaG [Noviherbaspirillum sp.]HEV2608669.1 flagellar protein FlaG [Noviherbaspirillum sp.]